MFSSHLLLHFFFNLLCSGGTRKNNQDGLSYAGVRGIFFLEVLAKNSTIKNNNHKVQLTLA